ncbi:MAG: class D beta-lactamase [Burkholderiaceae bacterium]|nr:class D beta-lactamase [Burkholderiaceae bacterium]
MPIKRFIAQVIAAAVCCPGAIAQTQKEIPELAGIFKANGVAGTFVFYDLATDTMVVSDGARAQKRFTPASTFKIPNALIGLDVRAVENVDAVLPYGGKPQRFKQWEKDMNLRNAMKASNVPVFQELARRIGIGRMQQGVKNLGYGNMEIGTVIDRFWLDGPLAISAIEQTEFLHRLLTEQLPLRFETLSALKEITLLDKTDTYELHGKTGWIFDKTPQLGWFIGWVERDGVLYPFALNIDMKGEADAPKRISIARECLKALRKL